MLNEVLEFMWKQQEGKKKKGKERQKGKEKRREEEKLDANEMGILYMWVYIPNVRDIFLR